MIRRALLVLALLALASPAGAQRGPRLEIVLPAQQALLREGPTVRGINMLDDSQLRDLLRNGFPARFTFRVELWSAGGSLFNNLQASTTWDVIVRYDPLARTYQVIRIVGDRATSLGTFADPAEAAEAVGIPVKAPLNAPSRDRYYYNTVLDVEVLSLSDLDELERWLRGELRPAIRRPAQTGTAVTRGIRTLVVRLLGGTKRHYEARTGTFRG
jgi:hypothetical protein